MTTSPERFRVSEKYPVLHAGTSVEVGFTARKWRFTRLVPHDLSTYDRVALQVWVEGAGAFLIDADLTRLTDAADLVDGVVARASATVAIPSGLNALNATAAWVGVSGVARELIGRPWRTSFFPGSHS